MTASSQRCVLLLCLWLPTLAFAGESWPGPNRVPSFLRPTMSDFWRLLGQHSEEQAEAMIRDTSASTGFRRADFTPGDMACMFWFNSWAQVRMMATKHPEQGIPPGFVSALERAYQDACHDDDSGGPGVPTGRGWNTVRRAILGRGDVQKAWRPLTPQETEVALSAAKWAAVGAAVLLSLPSLAVP